MVVQSEFVWWSVVVCGIVVTVVALRWPRLLWRVVAACVLLVPIIVREIMSPVGVRHVIVNHRVSGPAVNEFREGAWAVRDLFMSSSGYVIVPSILMAVIVVWHHRRRT